MFLTTLGGKFLFPANLTGLSQNLHSPSAVSTCRDVTKVIINHKVHKECTKRTKLKLLISKVSIQKLGIV